MEFRTIVALISFYGYNCQRQAHNLYPRHLWKNREKVWLDNEIIQPGTKLDSAADPYLEASYAKYTQNDYAPALMQEEALSFIQRIMLTDLFPVLCYSINTRAIAGSKILYR
jgi:hypothetical protein